MKKLIISAALTLLIFSYNTSSQFLTGFGLKAGATFGMQKFEYTFPVDIKTYPILGYNAGLYCEMLNNKLFNIVVDAGYEQRGHSTEMIKTDEFGNEIGTVDFFSRTHYATIGLLGKIKYETSTVSPYLLIGPRLDLYMGYKLSASDKEISDLLESQKSTMYEDTKKQNYSINFGAGLQFEKLLPFKTLIEFNYSPALNSSYHGEFVTVKDHYFNIKLGVNFIKSKTKKIKK